MSTQRRVPAGFTTGGQFSTSARGESTASLTAAAVYVTRYVAAGEAEKGDRLLGSDGGVIAVVDQVLQHASKPGFVVWKYQDGTTSTPMRAANANIRVERATRPDPVLVAKQEALDAAAEGNGLTGSRLIATPEGADLEHDGARYTLSTDSRGNDLFVYAQDTSGRYVGPSIDAEVLVSVARASGLGPGSPWRAPEPGAQVAEIDSYYGARSTLRKTIRDAGMPISDLP
jgi:hypothetical protein